MILFLGKLESFSIGVFFNLERVDIQSCILIMVFHVVWLLNLYKLNTAGNLFVKLKWIEKFREYRN